MILQVSEGEAVSCTRPNWDRSALVTIDTQNDFTPPDAPARIDGTLEALPGMVSVLEAFRAKGMPIIHVVRIYKEDGPNVDLCRREAIERGLRVVAPTRSFSSDAIIRTARVRPCMRRASGISAS